MARWHRKHTKPRFFISYRRTDTAAVAARLHDRLLAAFTDARVFMDLHTIRPGEEFPEKITQALRETDVVLALIGPGWAGTGPSGARRIDDERDFVRIEVATALELHVPVLPVMVGGADSPPPEDLPLDVARISRLNALRLEEATSKGGYDRIVDALPELVGLGRTRPAPVPDDLIALWVSTGTGDSVLQYDIYTNGTYQFVGAASQEVPGGTFEFTVCHEGAVTVSGSSITFAAFRASADRSDMTPLP